MPEFFPAPQKYAVIRDLIAPVSIATKQKQERLSTIPAGHIERVMRDSIKNRFRT
jgi:hypothetical protein